jgi:hypothetical protein
MTGNIRSEVEGALVRSNELPDENGRTSKRHTELDL